jgi:hypothetical protein
MPYKSMTRRVIKPQPKYPLRQKNGKWHEYSENPIADEICNSPWGHQYSCPFVTGQRLWVRETWRSTGVKIEPYAYKAGGDIPIILHGESGDHIIRVRYRWNSACSMPRKAARLFLEVKNVRVERIQDITNSDAIAEGMTKWLGNSFDMNLNAEFDIDKGKNAVAIFSHLWDTLNAKRGYSWDSNTRVWVCEFMRAG